MTTEELANETTRVIHSAIRGMSIPTERLAAALAPLVWERLAAANAAPKRACSCANNGLEPGQGPDFDCPQHGR